MRPIRDSLLPRYTMNLVKSPKNGCFSHFEYLEQSQMTESNFWKRTKANSFHEEKI